MKGSKTLEALSKIENAVFDKTGTLTTGKLSVTSILSLDDSFSPEEILCLAAMGESFSSHPMAPAVVNRYAETKDTSWGTNSQEIAWVGGVFSIG